MILSPVNAYTRIECPPGSPIIPSLPALAFDASQFSVVNIGGATVVSLLGGGGGGGGYNTILNGTTELAQETKLAFDGSELVATPGVGETDVALAFALKPHSFTSNVAGTPAITVINTAVGPTTTLITFQAGSQTVSYTLHNGTGLFQTLHGSTPVHQFTPTSVAWLSTTGNPVGTLNTSTGTFTILPNTGGAVGAVILHGNNGITVQAPTGGSAGQAIFTANPTTGQSSFFNLSGDELFAIEAAGIKILNTSGDILFNTTSGAIVVTSTIGSQFEIDDLADNLGQVITLIHTHSGSTPGATGIGSGIFCQAESSTNGTNLDVALFGGFLSDPTPGSNARGAYKLQVAYGASLVDAMLIGPNPFTGTLVNTHFYGNIYQEMGDRGADIGSNGSGPSGGNFNVIYVKSIERTTSNSSTIIDLGDPSILFTNIPITFTINGTQVAAFCTDQTTFNTTNAHFTGDVTIDGDVNFGGVQDIVINNIGTTKTPGLVIENSTAAGPSAGNDQYSPAMVFRGFTYFGGASTMAEAMLQIVGREDNVDSYSATSLRISTREGGTGPWKTNMEFHPDSTEVWSDLFVTDDGINGTFLGVSGNAIFGNGLAAAPSLTFSNDLASGFYSPASGQVGVSVSGANISTWSSTGFAIAVSATVTHDSVGTATTPGLTIKNTTAAGSGADQYSPALLFQGHTFFSSTSTQTEAMLQLVGPAEGSGSMSATALAISTRSGGSGSWTKNVEFNTHETWFPHHIRVSDNVSVSKIYFDASLGQVSVASGTLANPTYIFTDSDTGFYEPSAGFIGVAADGFHVADFSSPGGTTGLLKVYGDIQATGSLKDGSGGSAQLSLADPVTLSGYDKLTLSQKGNTSNPDLAQRRALNVTAGVSSGTTTNPNSFGDFVFSSQNVNLQLPNGAISTLASFQAFLGRSVKAQSGSNTITDGYGAYFSGSPQHGDSTITFTRSWAMGLQTSLQTYSNGLQIVYGDSNSIGVGTDTGTWDRFLAASYENNVPATVSVNQNSPITRWIGQGWKTNSVAGSQPVAFGVQVRAVTGTANPSATWALMKSINNGNFSDTMTVDSNLVVTMNGTLGIGTGGSTPLGIVEIKGNDQTIIWNETSSIPGARQNITFRRNGSNRAGIGLDEVDSFAIFDANVSGAMVKFRHGGTIWNVSTSPGVMHTFNQSTSSGFNQQLFVVSPANLSTMGDPGTQIDFNFSGVTHQFSNLGGTVIAEYSIMRLKAPTLNFNTNTGSPAITNCATLIIEAAPIQGGNATFTNTASALWIKAGQFRVDGDIKQGSGNKLGLLGATPVVQFSAFTIDGSAQAETATLGAAASNPPTQAEVQNLQGVVRRLIHMQSAALGGFGFCA